MTEFWESAYKSHHKMWGENPTDNALNVLELFQRNEVKSVLIPGFGYGRNAKVFYDEGFSVSGIEISKTAIERARKYFGNDVTIHHGSVTDMPFDQTRFQAIYSYSLIHLLNKNDRLSLIKNCYAQLMPNGIMVFVALSKNDKRFGEGVEVEKDTFHSLNGLNLHFYDQASIKEEFGQFHLVDLKEINEPEDDPSERHWMIICRK